MPHLLVIAFTVATFLAADATGTWTGTFTPNGGQEGTAHLVLKQDGDKLTGTAGPSETQQRSIQNGKADNGKIVFEVVGDGGVMKFNLKQDGDEITGDVTRERDGETQTAKLAVKRAK